MIQPALGSLSPKEPEPNPFDGQTDDLKKAVSGAKEILVLIRDNPKLDHVASGLGLYLSLKAAGKSVTVACTTPMRVEFNRLVSVDKVTQSIGNRNLVVSFPYVKDSIEKVSYHVDESRFNLVIQPKPGFPSLQSDKVNYSYSGAEADLVFVVGAQKLDDLGVLYQAERQLFDNTNIVNIDASPTNTKFAPLNLVWSEFSSCAEVIVELIQRLGLSLDADTATNLLAGLNDATQNFQRFNVKASAFAVAAKLMQSGGKKPITASPFGYRSPGALGTAFGAFPQPSLSPSPLPQFPSQPTPPASNPTAVQPPHSSITQETPISHPSPLPSQPAPATPATPPPPVSRVRDSDSPTSPEPEASDTNSQPQSTKDDWLKPKIYRGSTKV